MISGRGRPRSRRFWVLAALFGLFVLCDIALFSWLIFRSLSQRELDRVLLETRQEARDLAGQIERGAERSGGDLFTAVSLEQETLTYIDSVLRQRHSSRRSRCTDRDGVLVMKRRTEGELAVPPPVGPARPREIVGGAPRVETRTVERQESKNLRLPAEAIEAARRHGADRRLRCAAHRPIGTRDGATDRSAARRPAAPDGAWRSSPSSCSSRLRC